MARAGGMRRLGTRLFDTHRRGWWVHKRYCPLRQGSSIRPRSERSGPRIRLEWVSAHFRMNCMTTEVRVAGEKGESGRGGARGKNKRKKRGGTRRRGGRHLRKK